MFYYTFTTFDCNFIPRNAEICKVSSETKNVGKAHKYRLNRHLPTYEKIIKNLYSFFLKKLCKIIIAFIKRNDSKSFKANGIECVGYSEKEVEKLVEKIKESTKNESE